MTGSEIAEAVRSGRSSAVEVTHAALARAETDPFNAYTDVVAGRAMAQAAAVAGGYFECGASDQALAAVAACARSLGTTRRVVVRRPAAPAPPPT